MNEHVHISMFLTSTITISSILFLTILPQSQSLYNYSVCSEQPYNCGELSNIYYPFWGQNRPDYCGGGYVFNLKCNDDHSTSIQIDSQSFTVKEIDSNDFTIRMVRPDLARDVCSPQFINTYLNPTLFHYSHVLNLSIFYNCSSNVPGGKEFTCGYHDGSSVLGVSNDATIRELEEMGRCERHILVPVDVISYENGGDGVDGLQGDMQQGFWVNYTVNKECMRCLGNEGACWSSDIEKHMLSCYYCPEGSNAQNCPVPKTPPSASPPPPFLRPPPPFLRPPPPLIPPNPSSSNTSNKSHHATPPPPKSMPRPTPTVPVPPPSTNSSNKSHHNTTPSPLPMPTPTPTPTPMPTPIPAPMPTPMPTPILSLSPPSPSSSNSSDKSHHATSHKWNTRMKLIIGVTGVIIAGLCIAILYFRCKPLTWQGDFELIKKNNQQIEAFLKNHGTLTLKRYKLSDVKKMTKCFEVKLGQGGFGAVYKGKLPNGTPVAIKILNASKKNIEDFINEVASISKTSHINVVTLLGFCLEGQKRALIYEFMPNGSLDKFIYRNELKTITPLSWDVIYQIAMGIARGLEYLHRGCNTRILHFDIKPHNILLDENFSPKISDFGLAKLCPRHESIISMSDARGTMGYVAPEVLNRYLAGVSHKSDVYSYGMMLLEMVGGRKNTNAEASHTSEIYFPHWVYNKLELDSDLRLDEVMTSDENEMAKRLTIVGLWCIQTFPNDRPTMSRVIDMLEENMNRLEMPPKPLLSSPSRSLAQPSTS